VRNLLRLCAPLLVMALLAGAALASSNSPRAAAPTLTVMTRNLYLGTNLLPLATTAPGAQFDTAVNQALASVEATSPVARMRLIAHEIADAHPDLVGLQEATIWASGPVGGRPTHVVVDYLKVITAELSRLHAGYRLVAKHLGLHLQAQSNTQVVSFTNGDAVLARAGVTVRDVKAGDFVHQLKLTTPALGPVTVTRGWISLIASAHSAHFRFVDTHLEAYSTSVRLDQAKELVAGPLNTRTRTIVVGDLNSSADLPNPSDRPPFIVIRNAGYKDERTRQPNCCFNDDLRTGKWDHIVDHIMARPSLRLGRSFLTGRETTAAGLHPSDHGGVVTVFDL
jgi:endonuclease/exonuclease/phosphatase family metal-dependent hydrolase